MKSGRISTLAAAALIVAVAVDAQDPGRRGRRGRRPRTAPQQPAKPVAKKKATKPAPTPIAYTNAIVHVGDGTVLRNATVVTKGDKLGAIGPGIEIPKGAKIFDCSGKYICPGFVIFDLSGVGASPAREGSSYRDGIDPFAGNIKRGLSVGITSYLTVSSRGGAAPSGNSAVIKLVPGSIEGVIVKEPAVMAMSVPQGAAAWKTFEDNLKKVRDYRKNLAAYEKKKAAGDKSAKPPKSSTTIKAFLSVMEGKTKLRMSGAGGGFSRRRGFGGGGGGMNAKAARSALRVAKALGVGVILDSADEAWTIADEVAATSSSVITKPRSRTAPDPNRSGKYGSSIHAAAILSQAGVPVAVLPPGGIFGGGLGTGGILGQDLNTPTVDPCFAIRGGMDPNEALATITLFPAMMMGVADRIGSIETGKDADLLILDGEPLHYKTFVETAIVNGKVVYEKAKEPFFRHIRSNH